MFMVCIVAIKLTRTNSIVSVYGYRSYQLNGGEDLRIALSPLGLVLRGEGSIVFDILVTAN